MDTTSVLHVHPQVAPFGVLFPSAPLGYRPRSHVDSLAFRITSRYIKGICVLPVLGLLTRKQPADFNIQ